MRKLLFAILILACAPWAGAAYLGDYADDETVHFTWSSYDGDGASVTRATDGTISVYKDGGVTQSTLGVTDTEDFDSLTGIHSCDIYTTHTFYATGADYSVVLSASTIDGNVVNAVLAEFSIQNRYMRGTNSASLASALTTAQGNITTILSQVGDLYLSRVLVDTTIASAGRAVTTLRLTAGSDQNDAYNGMWVILDSNEGDGVYVSRHISDYDGSNKQVTFTPAVIHDPVDGGLVYIVPGPVHENENIDTLLARLTALRAGYLDNLSVGAVAQAAALTTHDTHLTTSTALILSTGSTGPWTTGNVGAVTLADGAHGGSAAVLTLKSVAVSNNAGSAVTVTSTGGNGDGITATGNGTGDGLAVNAGATGHGIDANGGATSGDGINATAPTGGRGLAAIGAGASSHGILGFGSGSGSGLYVTGGTTGSGFAALGGASSGAGFRALGQGGNAIGFDVDGNGSGKDFDAAEVDLILSTGSTGPWTTGVGGADQTTTNAAILAAIENAVYGLSAIRARGDAAWVTGVGGTDTGTTLGLLLAALEIIDDFLDTEIGTPVALDGGDASLAGMLIKMADDNGGADFDAGTDSQTEIRDRGDAAWTGDGAADQTTTNVAILKGVDDLKRLIQSR